MTRDEFELRDAEVQAVVDRIIDAIKLVPAGSKFSPPQDVLAALVVVVAGVHECCEDPDPELFIATLRFALARMKEAR